MLVSALMAAAVEAAPLRPGDFVMLSPPNGGPGTQLVVLDGRSPMYSVIASGGYLTGSSGSFGATDLCVRRAGDILVTVPGTGLVRVDPASGDQTVFAPLSVLGEGIPAGILEATDGSVYVSVQAATSRVLQVSADGSNARVVTSGGYLPLPAGMCYGPDRALYVCETIQYPAGGGGGIVRVDPASGAQTPVAGNPPLVGPFHVALAPDGTLWSVQFGGHSLRTNACVVSTRTSDGYSVVIPAFDCTAYGIAIRNDGTTVVGECYRISGDCYGGGDLYAAEYPAAVQVSGVSGPVAVVPELATPTTRTSWGRVKAIYR